MIDGCLKWQQQGLAQPPVVRAATEEYFEDQDVFSQWLQERCVIDVDDDRYKTPCIKAFANWKIYADELGEYAGSSKTFGSKLRNKGIVSKSERLNGSVTRCYIGLKLREIYDEDDISRRGWKFADD
jgi:putative DNA primase/helicase